MFQIYSAKLCSWSKQTHETFVQLSHAQYVKAFLSSEEEASGLPQILTSCSCRTKKNNDIKEKKNKLKTST